MTRKLTITGLLSLMLLLTACSAIFLEKKPSEPPPPPRTAEARALRINLALFRHKAERFRREALYLQLREEGKMLLEGMTRE